MLGLATSSPWIWCQFYCLFVPMQWGPTEPIFFESYRGSTLFGWLDEALGVSLGFLVGFADKGAQPGGSIDDNGFRSEFAV
jgi:hypothetical protein